MRLALVLALGVVALAPGAARAQSADLTASAPTAETFHAALDRVFGPGNWRETSGFRSQARENELRREGAGTVRPGQVSRHSLGTPEAPGAYDLVVPGLSSEAAAARLRGEDGIARVVAERAHGGQGPHLHVEPAGLGHAGPAATPDTGGDGIYLRVVNGRRNPLLSHASRHVIIVD